MSALCLAFASACNSPGYSVPGGSKSANEAGEGKPAKKASGGKASGKEKKGESDTAAPPPDLPDYAPIDPK